MKKIRIFRTFLTVLSVFSLAVLIPLTGCGESKATETDKNDDSHTTPIATYTITYDLDGGTVSVGNRTEYTIDTEDFTLNNPTKTNYTFVGWSGTGIDGTTTSVTVAKGSVGNRSYTAHWLADVYNVTLNDNGATTCGTLTTYTYGVGATLPVPTKTNYDFGGWYESSSFSGNAVQSIKATDSGNKTYYAKWTEKIQMKKSLKILAIGNSFSIDSMEYVYSIAKFAGYDEIVLGNLYIGGCSLQTHANNVKNDTKAYRYFKSNPQKWMMTETGTSESSFVAISDVIGTETWDYVSLQQNSDNSGRAETYDESLNYLINYVKTNTPQAKIVWHMTWAYPHNSAHYAYKNYYGQNQMTMYGGIINAVTTKIVPNSDIYCVLPVGTAVQNARTSFIGDNFSRDELHLSVDTGRVLAAMTWVAKLTGYDLTTLDYANVSSVIKDERTFNALVEAAVNAVNNPYEITQSSDPFDNEVKSDAIKSLLAGKGFNAEDYYLVNPHYTFNAYWNSGETNYNGNIPSTIRSVYTVGVADIFNRFICTGKFKRAEIPYGSIILNMGTGIQYRPDGWVNTDVATTVRPDNVTSSFTVVDNLWWGDFTVRAFNLSRVDNNNLTSADIDYIMQNFVILIPKNGSIDDSVVTVNKTIVNSEQNAVNWSFADNYVDGTYSAITVNKSVLYNFVYNNSNLNANGNYYRNFYLIFGPTNESGDGAAVIWDGVAIKNGQFVLDFMVNFDSQGSCRIYVRPIDVTKGVGTDDSQFYTGFDWMIVGSCSSGGKINITVSVSEEAQTKLLVSGDNSSVNLTEYFNGVNGVSYKNSANKTNIAVRSTSNLLGSLVFESYCTD